MFKNVLGAVLGSKLAPKHPTAGSATGAALATAVPFVLSRLSIPAMLAIGAGGYLWKRHKDKEEANGTPPEKKGALSAKATGATGKKSKAAKKAEDAGVINPPPGGAINGSGKDATAGQSTSA